MPLLLRKIRKSRWQDRPEWLGEGEVQADAVMDFEVKQNEISVWCVQDDRSDLAEIISALAATRDHLVHVDYALFDQNAIVEMGIEHEREDGKTPHVDANTKHWDLVRVSGQRLLKLAEMILARATFVRVLPKEVGEMLAQAVQAGKIRIDLLKDNVREKLKPQLETGANAQTP